VSRRIVLSAMPAVSELTRYGAIEEAHVLGCICSLCVEIAKQARDEQRRARNKRKAKTKGHRL